MISRGMMERQLYADGTLPDVYEDPVTNLADRIGVTTDEARRIINTMENPYKMMDMLPPNPREEFKGGGISSLKQARDVLEAQALPGEFLAYINPKEAKFLKYMGGAGIPINSSGIPSYFGGIGKAFKSAVKGITGAAKSAVGAVKDFAKSDIGQIALSIAAPYALSVPFGATGTSIFGRLGIAGSVGGSAFLGNALRAGIGNLAIQGLTRGKFDIGQAAKAGIIQGGIQTGLQRGFGPKTMKTDLTQGDVSKGGDVLKSTVVQDPSIDFEGVQYADAAQAADAFTTTPSMEGFTQAPTISPTQTTEGVMGLDTVYGGPEYTASTLPETGVDRIGVAQASERAVTKTTPSFDYGPDIADVQTVDIGGKTYGAAQFPPVEAPTAPTGIMDIVRDESLTLPQKISEGAKNLVGLGGGDETLKTLIDQPSLSNLMSFAKNNPELLITSASLLSALSVPKQPEETDFDYEERMKLVNDYASYYGERAGVDMSGSGSIDDYETYYSQRAGVAMGGSPEVPTGEVRTNPQGVMELDYRETGGRVPIGIREKADDVPAMLSKDEFVFTSKAVKNAGNGDVDKGAERLYKVMDILENGGTI